MSVPLTLDHLRAWRIHMERVQMRLGAIDHAEFCDVNDQATGDKPCNCPLSDIKELVYVALPALLAENEN